MTPNNFAVTSLALIICWLANVEAATTREECLNLCQTQYLSLQGQVTQLHLETIQFRCQSSCLSLPLASTLNTGTGSSSTGNTGSGTTTINKADCLIQCDIDYNSYRGRMTENERQRLLTTCRSTCQNLPDTTKTKTPTPTDKKGSFQQCENICDKDNERYTKAGELSTKFIEKIWLACKSECFKTYSQSTVKADCQKWAEKLRGMYASEQPDAFLSTLQERAIEACGSGTTTTTQ